MYYEKIIEKVNKNIYSMDGEKIFGKYIDNKKITDYNIIILKNNKIQVNDIISNLNLNIINKDIFDIILDIRLSFTVL